MKILDGIMPTEKRLDNLVCIVGIKFTAPVILKDNNDYPPLSAKENQFKSVFFCYDLPVPSPLEKGRDEVKTSRFIQKLEGVNILHLIADSLKDKE